MRKSFITTLYFCLAFFMILWDAHAWFTWFLDSSDNGQIVFFVRFAIFVMFYIYAKKNEIILLKDPKVLACIAILCLTLSSIGKFGLFMIPGAFFRFYPIWVILSDSKNRSDLLKFVSKAFALLLIPGIILHVVFLVKDLPPTLPIVYPSSELYIFYNYGFLIKGFLTYESSGLRFQSVFLEPAYCGTLCSFLIYALKFNLKKWYSIVLIIGLMLTMSLAGYVLTITGYMIFRFTHGGRIINFCLFICILFVSFTIADNYNGGNNAFHEKFTSRLELDKDKGITGNNRVGDGADYYLSRAFKDGDLIFGLGSERIDKINGSGWTDSADYDSQIRGAGYKIFVLTHGIIRTFLFLLCFYLIASIQHDKSYAYGFLFLIYITFIQASYPLSYAWWIPFIIGINQKKVRQ